MNLFTIFAMLTLDSSQYESGLDNAERSATSVGSKIGSALKTAGKIGAAGMGVASAAVIKMTKDAVDSYGRYEQLVGGVETLFDKSAGKVEKYADNAYKTAGMSANDYMETVTSFSASLLQSLGNDTDKAADYADRAIVDMADNANKMGTDISSIQNAYQGFAKQNYTMLDNLKLGYGGTKEEMARLIEDASKLTKEQEELGVSVDSADMSFGNIVNAISVMQKHMKIAGATADEAGDTIEGSATAAKASWQNLLTSFGRGNRQTRAATKQFMVSMTTMIKNIVPVAAQALTGIAEFVKEMAPAIAKELPGLISELLPKVLSAAGQLFKGVAAAIPGLFNGILQAVQSAVGGIFEMLKAQFPEASGVIDDFAGRFGTVMDMLKTKWDLFVSALSAVKDFFTNVLWPTIEPVVTAIVNAFSAAYDSIFSLFGQLNDIVNNTFSQIIEMVRTGDFSNLGTVMFDMIKQAFSTVYTWAQEVFGQIVTAVQGIDWIEVGNTILGGIKWAFSTLYQWAHDVFTLAVDAIKNIDWVEVGTTIFNFIISAFSNIANYFSALFTVVAGFIKSVDWVEVGTTIAGFIQDAFVSIATWFSDKFTEAKDAIGEVDWEQLGKDIWKLIQSAFSMVSQYYKALFTVASTTIKNIDWAEVGTTIWNLIKAAFSVTGKYLKAIFTVAASMIKQIDWAQLGKDIWNWIKDQFAAAGAFLKKKFFEARDAIKEIDWLQLGKDIWQFIKDGFKDVTGGIGAWFKGQFEFAVSQVTSIDWLKFGQDIFQKIKDAFTGIDDFFKDLFDFSGIHINMPHIKPTDYWTVPYFNIRVPWNWSIEWFKKAYDTPIMFNSPTVVPTASGMKGFGDGAGGEIVLSERKLREIAGGGKSVTINVYQQPGEDGEDLAQRISDIINRNIEREEAAFA